MDEKKLKDAVANLTKLYGNNAVINMAEAPALLDPDLLISSGSVRLDRALGGGYLKGRIIEIFGPESSGKTTLALHAMAEAQKSGVVLYVDTENAFDPRYAESLGIDLAKLYVAQPSYAEEAFEVIEAMVATGEVSLFVLDSVAGLSPKKEMEGDAGDSNMGLLPRYFGQHLRKVKHFMKLSKTVGIYINQIRMKLGVMFGNPETTTGGNALKFFASVRIDIRTKKREVASGFNRTRAKTVKNRITTPFQEVEFDIVYGKGIDKVSELVELGVDAGVVEMSGSWYSFAGNRLGHGKPNAVAFIRENQDILEQIKERINATD